MHDTIADTQTIVTPNVPNETFRAKVEQHAHKEGLGAFRAMERPFANIWGMEIEKHRIGYRTIHRPKHVNVGWEFAYLASTSSKWFGHWMYKNAHNKHSP